jgi:hypothetical protein
MSVDSQTIYVAAKSVTTESVAQPVTVLASEGGDCGDDKKSMLSYLFEADFVKYLLLLLIVFLLILIVANNKSSIYFSSSLPSWAISLTGWAFLILIVFFLTAYSLTKGDFIGSVVKSSIYKWIIAIVLLLIVISIFVIFQCNNFRASFWILFSAAVITLILLFFIASASLAAALWLLPLLALEIFMLVEIWQIIKLNNY